ncbi:hypothetical protein F4556_007128 [Kitasatospora gansuensis]|uniref:Uncharacterized protein n=1 Tax=Kitasatospora gansuensis TaxID=258050 RepID=A0A7W7SKJ9_9ACTN|nr:hypothetical protein [Kitasatospora gansuensis]MBB4951593.1 hypothetical protein [Kitasatospora gansuensis]
MCSCALRKEAARGDRANNLLLILEDQHGCTRHQAIERLRHLTHERFARFLRLETHSPDFDDILGPLPDLTRRPVARPG